jgi:FRG domain
MTAIRTVRCSSWGAFKRDLYGELFDGGAFEEQLYLFRGVGSDEWHLESSFDRFGRDIPLEERPAEAAALLRLFAEECQAGEGEVAEFPGDLQSRVALAQHHGLPTRGLDWTESPYVAGYFAFADAWSYGQADERGHVAIWALDLRHELWTRAPEEGVEIGTTGRSGNERMIRQRAALTYLHAPFTGLDVFVSKAVEHGDALIRFSLAKSQARVALADLAAMGITATRLFPDREGAARAARLRYAIRRGSARARALTRT